MDGLNLSDLFTIAQISDAINIRPNKYGRLNELGLFPARPAYTSTIVIEEQNGVLNLLSTTTPSGPNNVGTIGKRQLRSFNIPKLTYDEGVKPEDVIALRAFGTQNLDSIVRLVNDKLATARDKHDITLEWLRIGALTGNIVDGDGSTVLYNLFTEYGISQHAVDFTLGTATTNVLAKAVGVKRWIEQNLKGETMSGVRVLCSDSFFDSLVGHANVKAAYANWQAAQDRLGGDMRTGFTFGGITFENYSGSATDTTGATQAFIATGDARAFPEGTVSTFSTYWGPADFNESVGTPGQPYYAKMAPVKHDRGYEIHTQSNPLPICKRPAVLVRCYTSN